MNKQEASDLWLSVRANSVKLDACAFHEFEPSRERREIHDRNVTCKNCGGTLDWMHAHWYEKGMEHHANRWRAEGCPPA